MKIGDSVWLDSKWRKGIIHLKISSETTRSWVVGGLGGFYGGSIKIPKKFIGDRMEIEQETGSNDVLWFDKETMNKEHWVDKNRYSISKLIYDCKDYDKLKKIAEIIEFKEES